MIDEWSMSHEERLDDLSLGFSGHMCGLATVSPAVRVLFFRASCFRSPSGS
jgi:hypothetical protein